MKDGHNVWQLVWCTPTTKCSGGKTIEVEELKLDPKANNMLIVSLLFHLFLLNKTDQEKESNVNAFKLI